MQPLSLTPLFVLLFLFPSSLILRRGQVLATALSMQTSFGGLRPTLRHVPPSAIAFATVWPLLTFAVDLAIRHHDRNKVRRLQQRLTLEFETLLGQTSPK